MKILYAMTAASVLAISGYANAEMTLSAAEMDGVSAAGFAVANADAMANGEETMAWTDVQTYVDSIEIIFGQFGAIFEITSEMVATANANSDTQAIAAAETTGFAVGTGLADTAGQAYAYTDTAVPLPYSWAWANNGTVATSIIIGRTASSTSGSSSAASLDNFGLFPGL